MAPYQQNADVDPGPPASGAQRGRSALGDVAALLTGLVLILLGVLLLFLPGPGLLLIAAGGGLIVSRLRRRG